MKNLLLFSLILWVKWTSAFAQNVDCDTVPVVASANAGNLTCVNPFAPLVGVLDPTALSYQWSGPGGFTSSSRVTNNHVPGVYTLTVTGLYGCTAQTSVQVADNCLGYPMPIPECTGSVPMADECWDACVQLSLDGYQGTNVGFSASNNAQYSNCTFVVHNDGWLAFVAGASSVSLSIISSGCEYGEGLQAVLLDECTGDDNALAIDCGTVGGAGVPLILSANNLIPGKVYFLRIDGFSGDACDFIIEELIPGCTAPPDSIGMLDSLVLVGASNTCSNADEIYTLVGGTVASAYLWTGPPECLINGLMPPVAIQTIEGREVVVSFNSGSSVSGYVCVRELFYGHPPSAPLCKKVTLTTGILTLLPNVQICYGEHYVLPWGEAAFESGTYIFGYDLPNGCDSVVRQKVVVLPPIINNLGVFTLCPSECFVYSGQSFCQPGVYNFFLQSIQGCDSTVTLTIQHKFAPDLAISNTTINCITPTIMPVASSSTAGTTFEWLPNYPTGPGSYQVIATAPNGCSTALQFNMEVDTDIPIITAHGGTLTCAMPEIELTANFSPTATVVWYGPGTQFAGPSVPVNAPGVYTAVATGTNGCTSSISVMVVDSCIVSVPQGLASDLRLTLFPNPANTVVRLEANEVSAFDVISVWSPDGRLVFTQKFSTPQQNYNLDLSAWYSGTYRLLVHSGERWRELSVVVVR